MSYRASILLLFVFAFACSHWAAAPPTEKPVSTAQSKKQDKQIPGGTTTPEEYLAIVSTAGNLEQQANDQIRAMNRGMRSHYAQTLADVSSRLDPVIVVQFDGVGGTFNLRDGKRSVKVQPVPQTYELAKCVAHVPLDIYVILAPYFAAPDGGLWQSTLSDCGKHVKESLQRLDKSDLTGEARDNARTILTESLKFMDNASAKKTFTLDDYRAYAKHIFPAVAALRYFATDVQVRSIIALLEKWRDEMGKERWRNLSAVVITPFTLSAESPYVQCMSFVMDQERVKDRLINIGGDYGRDVDVAISVLGRLYVDGFAARLVFPQNTDEGREMTTSLSSKRDLMAVPATRILNKIAEERKAKNRPK